MKNTTSNFKQRQSGFTMIELLVALTIGTFLTIASAYVLQFAQRNYVTNDGIARLQEQARYALSTIENDVRLANYWGSHNQRSGVLNSASNGAPTITNVGGDCNNNWSHNLSIPIYGTNNDTTSPAWAGATCIPDAEIVDETDTLVIYHADPNELAPADLSAGNIYIRSNELPQSLLFKGTTNPNLGNRSKSYKLSASGYYIRPYSFDVNDNIPMLRRISLVDGGAEPAVQDFEISPGVEDMQIQFGISAPSIQSVIAADSAVYSIDRYVQPDDAIFNNPIPPRILSVRVWLLMRAELPEQNFEDTNVYEYATKTGADAFIPTGVEQDYRRLLITKTIQLRNNVR